MHQITITKPFCAAHALRLPDGTTEPVHGHNWHVCVTVAADQLDACDMVMDFHILETVVDQLLATLNNRHLNEVDPFTQGQFNPTAERVAWWIGTQVSNQLPQHVVLISSSVTEAPGCTATFYPDTRTQPHTQTGNIDERP